MKLLTLRLKNFKGLSGFVLDLQGANATIKSDNAGGKTTVADAFYWLLTDKDSHNKKDFEIKTLDENGQPLHGLDHEVEATFGLPDGTKKTLKKTYREKWTKQRGKATATFSGHTVDHQIDGVPCKAGEFKDLVDKIAPEEILRLLTDPRHFNVNMHWEARRSLLLDVCGDVTDSEVIDSNPKLAGLASILEGREAAEHKKVIQGRQKEIQKELERIPTRIDEVNLSLPDTEGIDKKGHEANIKRLQEKIEKKEAEKRKLQSDGGAADLENEIAILGAKLQNLKNRLMEEQYKQREPLQEQKRELIGKADFEQNKTISLQHQVEETEDWIKKYQSALDECNTEYEQVSGREMPALEIIKDVCPTCGQKLPKEQVEAAKEKAIANFNAKKATDTEKARKSIKEITKKLEEEKERLVKLKSELTESKQKQKECLQKAHKIMEELENELPIPEENPQYKKLAKEMERKKKELEEVKSSGRGDISKIDDQINELKDEIRQSEKALSLLDQYDKGQRRIKELKAQERELAAEYEQLEQQLFMIEEFTRSKVKLLEDKINSRFNHARFKLFEEHINGGISETCVCLYGGVPYNAGLNAGHQIIVGLDIIATLADYYEFWPPVFVDNAESITDLPEMKQQVIKLVKPEIKNNKDRKEYQKLVVEVE